MSDCDNENISGALILVINRDTLSNEFTNFMNVICKKIPIAKSNVPNIIWKLPNLVGKKRMKPPSPICHVIVALQIQNHVRYRGQVICWQ